MKYFWQTTAGGTSTSFPTTGAYAPTTSGTYYVRAKSDAGECWSAGTVSQAITVTAAPIITTQPVNQTVTEPATATFSVVASNVLSYQWQEKIGAAAWTNVGTNSSSYTTTATSVAMSGRQYKVILTGSSPCAPVESDVRTLTVNAIVPPVISSSQTKSNMYGTADTYTITASSSPTYSTGPLPVGFTFTGNVITKANNVDVGTYNISITATNGGGSDTKNLAWTVTAKPLSVTGITGQNKVYDGTTATFVTGIASLSGIVGTDDVTLSGNPTFSFSNANVGTSKPILVSGYTLGGTKSGNYSLAQPTTLTANVTPKGLAVTTPSIASKVYDGSSATGAISVGTLSGFIAAETVTATATGVYADANAGVAKTATVTYVLANGANGGLSTNYSLASGTGTGNVTKAPAVLTTSSIGITTGGTYALPGSTISSTSNGVYTYTLTNNGFATLSGTTITAGSTVGSETLTVNQAEGTNHLAQSTMVTVNVVTVADGAWKSTSSGIWSSTASGSTVTWSRRINGSWVPQTLPTQPPTSGSANKIYIYTDVKLLGNNTAKDIVIGVDSEDATKIGILHASISTTFGKLIIEDGGTFSKEANGVSIDTEANGGVLEVKDGGVFLYNHSAAASSSIWNAKEMFHANSIFKVVTVNSSAMLVVPNPTDISLYTDAINGTTACFGNIIIDNSTGKMNLVPGGFNLQLTHRDLIFRNNSDTTPLSTGNITTIIGGNVIIENSYAEAISFLSTPSVLNITVKGNFIHNGTKAFRPTANLGSNSSFTIEGDLTISNGGAFVLNGATGVITGSSILNLKGDLSVSGTSIINSNATGANTFNLTGTGNGSTASMTQTLDIANPATAGNITFNVNSGAYVKLINQNFALGTNSKFNVLSGGTLDFGFAGTTALNILGNGTTGTGFSAAAGSYLKITSPAGVNSTSGTVGNIQTNTAPVFTQPLTYHYTGNTDQVMGTGVGATSSGKAIIVDLATKDLTLTPSTSFGITNAINANVNSGNGGILDIRKGRLVETDALYINGGSGIANGGALQMLPDTYYKITRPSDVADFDYIPRFYNTSITGGEIDLASNSGGQTLRGGRTYFDLTFSNGGTKEISSATEEINGLVSIMANTTLDGKSFTVGKSVTELLMDSGSRFKTGGNGAKPDAGGAYVLDPTSTIEFQGDSATKIKVTPQYENVDVSGSNVETGGKNFTVNNLLKVTNSTAMLTVSEVLTDSDTPYVVTAKKGIQVVTGGKAIFGNNANLLQDVDAANTGNITMLRNATVPNVQFNFWSSPVKDQTLYSLYTGVPLVMEYNSANDLFKTLPAASNPKSVFGKGYSIQGPSSSTTAPYLITAKFEGVPNNESSAVGSNTVPLSTAGFNYNLIGNPFPSNLNLVELYNANSSQFYNDGTSATPTAFLWDNTGNTQMTQLGSAYSGYALNNYATVNLSSGIGTPASILGSSGKKPNGIIRPGQGFIMRASETATGLVFKNNLMRTSAIVNNGTNSQYFKNNSTEANDHFWLKLSTSRNVNIVIALSYNRDATNAFERFDSAVLNEGVTENFYSLSSDSKKLAIQTRKGDLDPQDVIPLVIKISENGDQKISIDDKTGIFKENQNIYLKDKLMSKTVNLSNGDYTFSATKGTDATRFEIVFKDDLVLGTAASSKSDFTVYRDGSDYVIQSSKILGNVEVYDAAGRLVRSLKSTQKTVRLHGATLNEGLYIIRAENSGDIRTKKILK
ncbi:YDG domain-containing protein [Epilithonimonas lactis]|uniref:YDG domain-containing protein n=1 Tax=Epilithonimonas lactis TaxID=421072 RepID=A0A085BFJ1_9FLAO|nr:YDG domain-containing protein [Epilithonimonas lactis]KFC21236.1 hypothetical protein IO89_13620 [Epilithonimonas lactis]SEP78104.1 Por secretion system C-terminal sorting domain-containing protein [Epilithonimonas lactis]